MLRISCPAILAITSTRRPVHSSVIAGKAWKICRPNEAVSLSYSAALSCGISDETISQAKLFFSGDRISSPILFAHVERSRIRNRNERGMLPATIALRDATGERPVGGGIRLVETEDYSYRSRRRDIAISSLRFANTRPSTAVTKSTIATTRINFTVSMLRFTFFSGYGSN